VTNERFLASLGMTAERPFELLNISLDVHRLLGQS
jgi:hypothetical protein